MPPTKTATGKKPIHAAIDGIPIHCPINCAFPGTSAATNKVMPKHQMTDVTITSKASRSSFGRGIANSKRKPAITSRMDDIAEKTPNTPNCSGE